MLTEARGRLSIRAAAKLAGLDDRTWSSLEEGGRTSRGEFIPANPSDDTLESAGRAVRVDIGELFAAAGRTYTPRPAATIEVDQATASDLVAMMRELADGISALRADIDRLLAPEPPGQTRSDLMGGPQGAVQESRARRHDEDLDESA
jgi:transcriptional regulator with XRE-family HTH domain